MSARLTRRTYADLYGPTTGDRVRLADTELIVEVEKDFTVYGDEITFGGGKVIRDGMGQSSTATREAEPGALDLVITNALIVDHWGIVKGDIGIRGGRIVKVGKAGNPDTMAGVDPELVVGAATEVIAGENCIVTAGAIDSHIHFISPQQIYEALSNGTTTMLGGGTGPATGTNATTCTPGAWNLGRMLQAAEAWPMNFGFLGKGNASAAEPLVEQILAGACGLKLHEDWGTTPAAIAHANNLEADAELSADSRLVIPITPGKHATTEDSQTYAKHITRYKVRRGDTVQTVADNFNVPPTMVRRWNHLKGNSLRGRRVLFLHQPISPTLAATSSITGTKSTKAAPNSSQASDVRHEVKVGETLYSIATTHHTTVDALQRDNGPLPTIRPGMVLIIHPN